jgi:pyruvate formate lyase activating enzyme
MSKNISNSKNVPLKANFSRRNFLKSSFATACALCLTNVPEKIFSQEKPWKWSIEARHYYTEGKTAFCDLCPVECIIYSGKVGDCRVKKNFDGKLFSLVYGNPCTVHIDPIEKKPLYHFLPQSSAFSIATAGCVFQCLNCQNWEISQARPEDTRNIELMPDKVVEAAQKYKCESIAYTYSEPIAFYEYTIDTAKIAKSKGIKNVLVSSGYIKEKPLRELCKFIDAANIDLKSFSNDIYKKLNRGTLKPVLKTLQILAEEGVWLEITNLIIPSWTDDLKMIRDMCRWLTKNKLNSFPLHFSRFYPLHKLTNLPQTPVETLEKARQIALEEGIKYSYVGNVPEIDSQNTYCHKCKKLLIKRKGYINLENNIENGKCKFCKTKIPGFWS